MMHNTLWPLFVCFTLPNCFKHKFSKQLLALVQTNIVLRITEHPLTHNGIDNLERDEFGKHLLKWNLPETLSNIIPVRRELTIQTIPNAIHTLRPTLGSRAPRGRHFVPIPSSSSFLPAPLSALCRNIEI